MAEKQHMNLVFIGHVSQGKSTTVGRILFETGSIDERVIQRMKEATQQFNKPTSEFAFVLNTLKEERERGITIDISHMEFQTPKYYFTVIDAPGHRDFVKNMITGTSQADAAVLVVGAPDGVMIQTREHAILASILGIRQMIVGVNKMDMASFSQTRFEEVKKQTLDLLKTLGYKIDTIPVVPYSAYEGSNVKKKGTATMPWYTGPTLLELLDNLVLPPKPTDKALRLPIQDVFSISGFGTVPVGRVETGIMKPGDSIIFEPSGIKTDVKSIEMHHKQLQQAIPGDNIGFNIKGVDKKDIKRGDVVGPVDKPPTVAQEFTAQIVILKHPNVIVKGYTPVFHIHTAQLACTFAELLEKKDPKTLVTLEKNPEALKTGDVAIVKIKPTKPIVVEKHSDFPQLGKFAIRDMGETVGAGIVLEVVPRQA
jgi:elongation factor 1-alpha